MAVAMIAGKNRIETLGPMTGRANTVATTARPTNPNAAQYFANGRHVRPPVAMFTATILRRWAAAAIGAAGGRCSGRQRHRRLFGLPPVVGAPRDFGVHRRSAVPLQHTDAQSVWQRAAPGTGVRYFAGDDVTAQDVAVCQRTRCTARLTPVDVLEVPQPDFGCLPVVPSALYAYHRIAADRCHGPSFQNNTSRR